MEAAGQLIYGRSPDAVERNLWTCYASANAAFWATSLACRALDVYWPELRKTQGPRSYFSSATFSHAVKIAVLNIVLIAAGTVPLGAALFRRLHASPLAEGAPFEPLRELRCLAGCAVVVDLWFYWTHRAIHYGSLYRRIHKMHHKFTAPIAARPPSVVSSPPWEKNALTSARVGRRRLRAPA